MNNWTVDENKLLEDFRQLSDEGKAEAIKYAKALLDKQKKGELHNEQRT